MALVHTGPANTVKDHQAEYAAALREERAGLVVAGKTARVAAVDAELTRVGAGPPAGAPPGAQTATSSAPAETATAPQRVARRRT